MVCWLGGLLGCWFPGFPILVKSSAGGGGIGMQIASDYSQLVEAIEKTKNLDRKSVV